MVIVIWVIALYIAYSCNISYIRNSGYRLLNSNITILIGLKLCCNKCIVYFWLVWYMSISLYNLILLASRFVYKFIFVNLHHTWAPYISVLRPIDILAVLLTNSWVVNILYKVWIYSYSLTNNNIGISMPPLYLYLYAKSLSID